MSHASQFSHLKQGSEIAEVPSLEGFVHAAVVVDAASAVGQVCEGRERLLDFGERDGQGAEDGVRGRPFRNRRRDDGRHQHQGEHNLEAGHLASKRGGQKMIKSRTFDSNTTSPDKKGKENIRLSGA